MCFTFVYNCFIFDAIYMSIYVYIYVLQIFLNFHQNYLIKIFSKLCNNNNYNYNINKLIKFFKMR